MAFQRNVLKVDRDAVVAPHVSIDPVSLKCTFDLLVSVLHYLTLKCH